MKAYPLEIRRLQEMLSDRLRGALPTIEELGNALGGDQAGDTPSDRPLP